MIRFTSTAGMGMLNFREGLTWREKRFRVAVEVQSVAGGGGDGYLEPSREVLLARQIELVASS
jgi:hypothetical protein